MKEIIKLSNKQKKDLETILYFIPKSHKNIKITEQDIINFFEYSELGKNKHLKDNQRRKQDGFNALCEGKIWRGIYMGLYEESILDGSIPYFVLLKDIPESVKDFMKKEMFKGQSANTIEEIWQRLNNKTFIQKIQDFIFNIKFNIKYYYKKLKTK